MKDNIFIPQYNILQVAPNISWRACIVLNYISGWQLYSNKKVKKQIFDNEEYLWINYKALAEDLPLLRTKNKVLIGKIIDELVGYKLLKKMKTEDNTVYVRLTDLAVSLYNLPIQGVEETYTGLYKKPIQHNTTTNNTPIINPTNIVGELQNPNDGSQENKKENKPFSLDDYIKSLIESPRRDLHIIGIYWQRKRPIVDNQKAAGKELKMLLKAGNELVDFSDDRIYETMNYLEDYADFKWNLYTVRKYITEDLDNLIYKAKLKNGRNDPFRRKF